MKISRKHLRRLIVEELMIINETTMSPTTMPTAGANPNIPSNIAELDQWQDLFKDGSLDISSVKSVIEREVKRTLRMELLHWLKQQNWATAWHALGAVELGLIGLAIGIPGFFLYLYSDSKKGDKMLRYMHKMVGETLTMRHLADPRLSTTTASAESLGQSVKSNPLIYLTNKRDMDLAVQLFEQDIISDDVLKVVSEIWGDAQDAIKKVKQMKQASLSVA